MSGSSDRNGETRIAPRPDAQGRHKRLAGFALARFEAWSLPKLAAALPAWVTPDHLTGLGLLASTGIAVSYMLTNRDPAWLWAASGLLVVQWYGDSLDGTLARYRKIERPRGLVGVAAMLILLLSRATHNLKTLAALEPPGVRKDVQQPPT